MPVLQFARSTKYAATVAVKSLMETEGEEKRERIRRDDKNCNHRLTIKGSALMVGKIYSASFNDICRYVIVSCGGHFDRGGDVFIKNRCECHVTIKRE